MMQTRHGQGYAVAADGTWQRKPAQPPAADPQLRAFIAPGTRTVADLTARADKWCCFCTQPGHLSHACPTLAKLHRR